MCFALMSCKPAYDHAFGCPLHISQRATERDNGSSVVFDRGCGFVGLASFVVVSWVGGVVGRWLVRSFWLIGDREDENFEGSCAEIPKVSTGRSISVTSKALEIF
jgi:hypothetical protein